jgi:ABC-type transport system involved in multi-copper enzyme maturation permease subunit
MFQGVMHMLRAELQKLWANRWPSVFLLWVFPILGMISPLFFLLITSIDSNNLIRDQLSNEFASGGFGWQAIALNAWDAPLNPFGRLLVAAFIVLSFANEYQASTWKNLTVRRGRMPLILVKMLALILYIMVVFIISSIVQVFAYSLLSNNIPGTPPYFATFNGETLSAFAVDYALTAGLMVVSLTLLCGYACIGTMISRSFLGGLFVGVGLPTIESSLEIAAVFFMLVVRWEWAYEVYKLFPSYNIPNINSWVDRGTGLIGTIANSPNFQPSDPHSLGVSVALLLGYTALLVGLALWSFRRQDLTT